MNKIAPYIIQHLQLENFHQHAGFTLIPEAGYYCVFWWKEIPLGQLFIERGEAIDRDKLYQKIFNVIEPAIDFYITEQSLAKPDYKSAFLNGNIDIFSIKMDQVFSHILPTALPKSVDISVVICTRNRSSQLKYCLEQLRNQQCFPNEIIVVDNTPSDDGSRIVVAQFPEITYCREPRPGLDIARNTGARLAKSSIVAYIDDDVLVHSLWTYRTWEAFQSPNIQASTGLVIAAALESEAQQIFEKFWSFNRGYEDKLYNSEYFKKNLEEGPPVWEIGAGANMAFRKSVFEKVGYFDERLDVGAAGCSGDSEMWYRVLANGGAILYTPRAVVYHEHRKELKQLHKQLFSYMRGFAAAALIQQNQNEKAGYKKRLFRILPKWYWKLIISGFPRYSFQNRTLFSEIRGVISGILFYYKNKNTPS
ncbi:MAG: glycosyltransferase [Chitinophagaceae bacterium]